MTLQNLSKSLR